MDQHTGGKWLSNGTKHRKDNKLQASNWPAEYRGRESNLDKNEYENNMFNPIFEGNVQGQKHPGKGVKYRVR